MSELNDIREDLRYLRRRMARGEIDEESYLRRRELILADLTAEDRAQIETSTPEPRAATPAPDQQAATPGPAIGPTGERASGFRTSLPSLAQLDLSPDTILLNQWRIKRELGRGGFGAVFEAEEINLGQRQAVKVLDPRMVARAELLAQFRREVMLMRDLQHPQIVRVYDYREDRAQHLALISMEYVAGCAVRELKAEAKNRNEPIPIPLALRILEQTLEALAAAHEQGVIHRDVTPGNILLAGGTAGELLDTSSVDPGVKLVDFGIAGLVDRTELSEKSRALGTAAYVAPEVLDPDAQVTAAADLYGAGAVTYELLTGELPLGRFEDPVELREDLPRLADRLVLGLLERKPRRRPAPEEALEAARGALAEWHEQGRRQRGETERAARLEEERKRQDEEGREHERQEAEARARREAEKEQQEATRRNKERQQVAARARLEEEKRRCVAERWEQQAGRRKALLGLVAVAAVAVVAVAIWTQLPTDRPRQEPQASDPGAEEQSLGAQPSGTPPPAGGDPQTQPAEEPPAAAQDTRDDPQAQPGGESTGLSTAAATPDPDIEWVTIPAGSFTMGCTAGHTECPSAESPRHEVRIASPFQMAATETTNAQYRRCVQAGACREPEDTSAYRDSSMAEQPVVEVIWNDARVYCEWAGGRLPTEAEWEYAARGGRNDWNYPWGNTLGHENANYSSTERRDQWGRTASVGSFAPNGYGLYDMAGNAWEWVEDAWHDDYNGAPGDGSAWVRGGNTSLRVVRGGSWLDFPGYLRVSGRDRVTTDYRYDSCGFRCTRTDLLNP